MAKHKKRRNGEGSVAYNRRLNCYVGRVSMGGGRRKYFYGSKGDKSPAARIGLEERMQPYLSWRSADSSLGVGKAIESFIGSATHLAPSTLALYKTAAKHIVGDPGDERKRRKPKAADPIARKNLIDLEPSDIRAFYARLNTGETMKEKVHILLHRALEDAVRMEIIPNNPASKVRKPKPKHSEVAIWNPDQVFKFLKASAEHRLYALFVLALTTTMGPAELFGLRRSDVHLSEGYLIVNRNLVNVEGTLHEGATKTRKRRRRITLPRIAVEALRQRLEIAMGEGHAASPLIFTSDEGGPLRIENFRRRVWHPLIEKAEVPPITLYGMRHTANALMGYLGVPIAVASARMGHSSAKMTLDRYGHLFQSADAEAAEKIDALLRAK